MKFKLLKLAPFVTGFLVLFSVYIIYVNKDSARSTRVSDADSSKKTVELDGPDLSDARTLVGISQNVFVARVVKSDGQEVRQNMRHALFDARVIYNIKGEAENTIVLDQAQYSESGAVKPLQEGVTYLFATRHIPKLSANYHVSYDSAGVVVISQDSNVSDSQLLQAVQVNPKVLALLKAYPQEIVPTADISNGFDLNSFNSLTDLQKKEVFDKIKALSKPWVD